MSDNQNTAPDIKSVDLSEASGNLKPTFEIATTGNYKKYVKGSNKEYVQGTKVTLAGGVLDVAVTGRLNYNSDVVTSYNAARKLEFNLSKQYKLSLGGSHSIEKQSTVQTKEFVLMTVGMSVAEQWRWKKHELIINGVGKFLTLYKLPYLANTLFGQTTTGVYASVAPWGNPKGYSDWWQSNVMDKVGKNAVDYAGYVSYLNKFYTLTFKYESLFHATNIPRQVLQLSKEKGVLLTGGDKDTINSLEMTDSIHLSCKNESRIGAAGYKDIYMPRDEDADADESDYLSLPDKIQRTIAKKLTFGWAGDAKKWGEYNGLKPEHKFQSFLNISDSLVWAKSFQINMESEDEFRINSAKNISIGATKNFLIRAGANNSQNKSELLIKPLRSSLVCGTSNLSVMPSSVSIKSDKTELRMTKNTIDLNSSDSSKLVMDSKQIIISAGGGKITVGNNSVSIGSDLKVMGINASTKFNDITQMQKDIDAIKKDFATTLKKMSSDLDKARKDLDIEKDKAAKERAARLAFD